MWASNWSATAGGASAAASTSPRLTSISSASVTVTDSPANGLGEVAVDGDDALDRRRLARRHDPHRSPGCTVPPTIAPEKPRKSRSGRFTHCTGMRNGRSRGRRRSAPSRGTDERRAVVPGRVRARVHDVVAVQRGDRDAHDIVEPISCAKARYSSSISVNRSCE
jgi:hypothetical protein